MVLENCPETSLHLRVQLLQLNYCPGSALASKRDPQGNTTSNRRRDELKYELKIIEHRKKNEQRRAENRKRSGKRLQCLGLSRTGARGSQPHTTRRENQRKSWTAIQRGEV